MASLFNMNTHRKSSVSAVLALATLLCILNIRSAASSLTQGKNQRFDLYGSAEDSNSDSNKN